MSNVRIVPSTELAMMSVRVTRTDVTLSPKGSMTCKVILIFLHLFNNLNERKKKSLTCIGSILFDL